MIYTKYISVVRVNPYSAGIGFSRQNRGQILTSEVDPRTVRITIFMLAVDP